MGRPTHVVLNQPPPLTDYDVFGTDVALVEAVRRHAPGADLERLHELGALAGSATAQEWAREANTHTPVLRTHDRYGNRADEVDFHPAWHQLMRTALSYGLAGTPWAAKEPGTQPAAHVLRAAGFLTWSQAEGGHGCPVSMTYAAVPALRTDPALAAEWEPRLTSTVYGDQLLVPPGDKPGCLAGMGMTEKQGGTDVRANTTEAVPLAADGEYLLTGHKWFCSAPMCDVFLVLAQAPGGLTCFLVPRVLPDGSRNVFQLQRLKDKLGNRSNASSEVEFDGTWARRLGDEGRGVRTIIDMVAATRLDCTIGSAALMRKAVAEATHHAAHRRVGGQLLVDLPLMTNVLADLAVESEATTLLALRLAAAYRSEDPGEQALFRIAVAVSKYWTTKRGIAVAAEAMECLGGNGYVEDSGMPRIYKEAPVNAIWEGSGNVQALDVLRALRREPACLDAFLREIGVARGADHRFDAAVKDFLVELADLDGVEVRARRLTERMALLLSGSLLLRWAPPEVADAFCASRLGGEGGLMFGTLPKGVAARSIVDRARPRLATG
ncbi:acyl-CoA dehydrogenase family protein [Yinghuangia seranimata]|uniref:acyl-CoA dehydrogenase family protein n=1 Tax=Yinghuangia seranimata TaxID=408067 RepID=UPI00248CA757|nr:acyl-CoA dehydrogenase family protein [Yinghuangia seranimata]MDI2125151.1 acyl-CoA dehydrogenase family protein [Yinghuangia seranimata]